MPKRIKSSDYHDPLAQWGTTVISVLPLRVPAGMAIIAIVAFLAYLPALTGGFVLDDDLLLTDNNLIKATNGLYQFWFTTQPQDYWPATNTTFWIEWRLWKLHPAGYHVTNLILHIIESLLIWIILRKLSIPGAFLAAVIFAVHPVNVESVAWIASRKNLMAMLFFQLSILWFVKHLCSRHTPCAVSAHGVCGVQTKPVSAHGVCGVLMDRWYWLSLAAFVLAMLSKGSVAILPVLLLGITCWLRPLTRRDLLWIAPFFVVALVLAVVNMWFQTHGTAVALRTADFAQRLLGAGGVVWFYLYKALLPLNLIFVYPMWNIVTSNPLWWLPLLAALVVTAVLWLYRNSWGRPFLFAWGCFCVALVPVMGFADVGFMRFSLVADRYQHVAVIGVIALVTAGWSLLRDRLQGWAQWAATAVAVVVVAALTLISFQQSELYRDAVTLYKATIEKNPGCWMAENNLGGVLVLTGNPQEAIEHCQRALRLNPDYPDAHNILGNALIRTGRPQEAIKHCEEALRLRPNYPDAHFNLGEALTQIGRLREAIEQYELALRLQPDYIAAHNNLGPVLVRIGRLQEAIGHYEQALKINPDSPEAHNNLGAALIQSGRLQEACAQCDQALHLKPDYADAHYNMGNILVQTNRPGEAIEHFLQAMRLKPDDPDAPFNLGNALVKTGRPKEAIEYYRQAIRLNPDSTIFYYSLASAYARVQKSAEAIASARKALELAQSHGQTALAKEIEDWLKIYRASLSE